MACNADDDVAAAVASQWDRCAALAAQVPGKLEHDRATAAQPDAAPRKTRATPYATFRVEKLKDEEMSTGMQMIDHRQVTVEIRGLKAAVSTALNTARGLYLEQPLPIASPYVFGGRAMAVLPLNPDDLRKDEAISQGEDVWIGTLQFWVMSHRSLVPIAAVAS